MISEKQLAGLLSYIYREDREATPIPAGRKRKTLELIIAPPSGGHTGGDNK